jgi:hypothetical protein
MPIVRYSNKHNISETVSVSDLRQKGGRHLLCWDCQKELINFIEQPMFRFRVSFCWSSSAVILGSWCRGYYDHIFLSPDFESSDSWKRISIDGSGKLLLALASTGVLGSGSCGTDDHILLFHDSGSRATHSLKSCVRVRVTLRLVLCHYSVRLSAASWGSWPDFFCRWTLTIENLCQSTYICMYI